MLKSPLLKKLNIEYPIFQAPMAGVTTPELVAAVSNFGALGNIGAGYLSEKAVDQFITDIQLLTNKPFGINLFVPEEQHVTDEQINLAVTLMNKHLQELNIETNEIPDYRGMDQFERQIEVVLNRNVPVCSFTFGIPDDEIIKELKRQGIFIIGTATTVKEAKLIEKAKMDAVVVQGSEAGGHRGSFLEGEQLIGTMALVPQVVDHVSIPVIVAGGIMDGRGVIASYTLGAQAAQLGTAFLTTKECEINLAYKEALLKATEEETVLTSAFSGKMARGLQNKFIRSMQPYENKLPPFPYQNAFTRKIRSEAAKQQNEQYMSLWSGQAPRLTKNISVNELLNQIIKQCKEIKH